MKILLKDENLIAISKPYGIPSQKDPSGDADAMSLISEMLGACGEESKLWLVHRLDRTVGGVMVFARNAAVAAELSEKIADKTAKKEYLSVVDGRGEGGLYTDFLYKDAKLKKAFVTDGKRNGVKEAKLECTPLSVKETEKGEKTLLSIKLYTGRFHQIRAQLSHRKTPVCGDGKYGSRDNKAKNLALFSHKLTFEVGNKKYEIKDYPDFDAYPWSLFESEFYGK